MTTPITFQAHSPRHGLPFLFVGQSQKEFFVNEALARLDLLAHPAVEGEASDPPATPTEGECWLIGAAASGAWSGKDGQIAGYEAGDWMFAEPHEGMQVWDREHGQIALFRGGWDRPVAPLAPGGGSTIDIEARTAIEALIEALRNAGIFSAS